MSSAPVHIIVDDRERVGGMVPAILAARDDVTVEIARLDVGDYQVQQRIVVERKTASDFAASLIDGRLFRQAAALASSPKRAVLVLEACSEDCGDTGVRNEALQGALITDWRVLWPDYLAVREPGGNGAVAGLPRSAGAADRAWRVAPTGVPPQGYASASALSAARPARCGP